MKPKFVPPHECHSNLQEVADRVKAIEAWAIEQSQPATDPVRYEREVAADHATIEHLSALLEQARGARSSPPAREVPDSEVPDIEPWTGRTIAKHLRSIGMAIVYREGPRND